jgi:hypothetical protein
MRQISRIPKFSMMTRSLTEVLNFAMLSLQSKGRKAKIMDWGNSDQRFALLQ